MEKVIIDLKTGETKKIPLTSEEQKERKKLEEEAKKHAEVEMYERLLEKQKQLLLDCDWTQNKEAESILTKKCIEDFKEYRAKLREMNNRFPTGMDKDGNPPEFPEAPKLKKIKAKKTVSSKKKVKKATAKE